MGSKLASPMLSRGFLLFFLFTGSTAQEDCEVDNPDNGYFDWSLTEEDTLACNLYCKAGFSPYPRSWVSCSPSNGWTEPLSSLICSPSVLLLAGSGWQPYIDKVELFSLNLTCPTYNLPDLPIWSFGHSLDYVDGHIILCGSSWEQSRINVCWEMNQNNTWEESPNKLIHPRAGHISAVVGSRLFLIGGGGDETSSEVLDVTTSTGWEQGFNLKEDVNEACAVTLSDGRVAVLGSWRKPFLSFSHKHDGVIIYDVNDGSHESLPHMSVQRKVFGCGAFTKNGKEYLMATGGYEKPSSVIGPGVFWDTTEIYEIGSGMFGTWKTVDARIPVAGGFEIQVIEKRIIGIGYDPGHSDDFNIVLEYNVDQETWTVLDKTTDEHLHGNAAGTSTVPAARFGCA